jgi:Secretion system C-terminal sorting domain
MKKLYSLLFAAAFTTTAFAQGQTAIAACKKASGEISIVYELAKSCPAKDTFAKRTEIGFHSGANSFGAGLIREWNSAAGAGGVAVIKGRRMAGTTGAASKFHITIPNPTTYYNAGATAITNIAFVFNDGAQGLTTTANYPWYAEGKASKADNSGCEDFVITIATLATCATNTTDLKDLRVAVAPNPFKAATYITFSNPTNKVHTLTLMDAMGRVVRTYKDITSDMVEIKRENLTSGMYFAVLKNADGQAISQKLMAE